MKRIESVTKAYHSTRQKGLKKFESRTTTATIDTGEGAHVHGWGLYLQSDEMANREDYYNRFGGDYNNSEDYHIKAWGTEFDAYATEDYCYIDDTNAFKVYEFTDFKGGHLTSAEELLVMLKINGFTENGITYFLAGVCEMSDNLDEEEYPEILIHWDFDTIQETISLCINGIPDYKETPIVAEDYVLEDGTHSPNVSQYTVEIPDDMVFIDEDKTIPKWLSERYVHDFSFISNEDEYGQIKVFNCDDIMDGKYTEDVANKFLSGELLEQVKERRKKLIKELKQKVDWHIQHYATYTGKDFYNAITEGNDYSDEKASLWLSENGIDGMTYEGGRDHGCFVIYNCDKLKIVGEY